MSIHIEANPHFLECKALLSRILLAKTLAIEIEAALLSRILLAKTLAIEIEAARLADGPQSVKDRLRRAYGEGLADALHDRAETTISEALLEAAHAAGVIL